MIYLIVGNSGSGKTTQINRLTKLQNFKKIITYTTRPIRKCESNTDYNFISDEVFQEMKEKNLFFAITKIFNYNYAILKEDLLNYYDSKYNCVLALDVFGVKELKKYFPKTICIYLKIDKKIMFERMLKRNDDIDKIKIRMNDYQDFTDCSDFILNASKDEDIIYQEISEIIKNN